MMQFLFFLIGIIWFGWNSSPLLRFCYMAIGYDKWFVSGEAIQAIHSRVAAPVFR